LGSVETFPRKRGIATIADVWRVAPLATGPMRVREMRHEDCAAIRLLHREAVPSVPPPTLQQLESRRHIFPEGQLVAEVDGLIVGAAGTLVVRWDDYALHHTWQTVTGDGFFTTHDPSGLTLYGSHAVADTTRRGFGVARALYQAQRRICRRRNLRRIIAAARLPGYRTLRDSMAPEFYAMKVIWGDIADAALRFQMSQGFQYCGVIHDYLPEDQDSCGHAALLVWLNPLHSPPRPPAAIESQRQRKVA
jgi:GNAT superfamily N-acetyltransferase